MFLAVMLKPSAALQKEGIEGRAVMSVSPASIRFNVQKLSFYKTMLHLKDLYITSAQQSCAKGDVSFRAQ